MDRHGAWVLADIRHRMEACSSRVHNRTWGKTLGNGQWAWKAVGVKVFDRLHVRVWGRFSRG
jgi:hypothetical protein